MAGAVAKMLDFFDLRPGKDDELAQTVADAEFDAEYASVTELPRPRVTQQHADGHIGRIATVRPADFNGAPAIGEAFRAGTPVIMNLSDISEAEARRLIDFASGLVLGLDGDIEKVTNRVFLLSPASVKVDTSLVERQRHGIFGR